MLVEQEPSVRVKDSKSTSLATYLATSKRVKDRELALVLLRSESICSAWYRSAIGLGMLVARSLERLVYDSALLQVVTRVRRSRWRAKALAAHATPVVFSSVHPIACSSKRIAYGPTPPWQVSMRLSPPVCSGQEGTSRATRNTQGASCALFDDLSLESRVTAPRALCAAVAHL